MLVAGCEDSVDSVAHAAANGVIKCIRALQEVNQGVMDFSPVFPPFFGVLRRCLAKQEDYLIILGFEHIRMTFLFSEPLINDHMGALTELIFAILIDTDLDYDSSVKYEAQSTFLHLIRGLSKQFAKKGLVKPTFSSLMVCLAEEQGRVIKNENEDSISDAIVSCHLFIGAMAGEIPANYFADIAFNMSIEALSLSIVGLRKAGYAILGIIVLSFSNEARKRIEAILPLLIKGLLEEDLYTREAAAFALGEFAHYCNHEVCWYHHTIIPSLITALNNNESVVQILCCDALEHLSDGLKPNIIKPYLSSLFNCVGQLAQSNSPYVQDSALRALSSIATAAGTEFQSYTDETMTFLERFLTIDCRCEESDCSSALSCLGNIAVAIGKDQFKPCYYELGMKAVKEFLKSGKYEFMESAFVHIDNMACLLGKDFESPMKDFMPSIFEALNENELIPQNDAMDVDDYEDEQDDGSYEEMDVLMNESFVRMKGSAINAIKSLAKHAKSGFLPYLHQTIATFTSEDARVLSSFHDEIRMKAISVFPDLIEVIIDGTNLPIPTKGERLTFSQDVRSVAELLLQQCFDKLDNDTEKKVVSETVLTLVSIIERLGASLLDIFNQDGSYLIQLTQKILIYLNEKSPCQMVKNLQNNEEDDNEEEGEEGNDSLLLMKDLGKLIETLAKVLSNDEFINHFDQFHSKLLKFTKSSRSQADRDMIISCYATVFENIGSLSMKYADSILPVVKSALECRDGHVTRQNAAYCLGMLIETARVPLVPRYLLFLQWLYPVCIRKESEKGGADVDNALAAVARMIYIDHRDIPLSQVLPVMFAALPLRKDVGESIAVFKAFLLLVEKNDPTIIAMVKDLIPLLAENFKPGTLVPNATRDLAGKAINILTANSTCCDSVYSYFSTLTDSEHIEKLQIGLSAQGMVWKGKQF